MNHLRRVATMGSREHKRIIVCCDGTWMNSIGLKAAAPPSNVTRIAKCFKRQCSDGTPQIIVYDPGVGSGASRVDQLMGGAFGMGLEQNIRGTYNFICNNYLDGDEIILLGFSRGAFTARSVADMIGTFGLLTPEGHEHFNEIFEDYENIADPKRNLNKYMIKLDAYPGEKGRLDWIHKRKKTYIDYLVKNKLTRGRFPDHDEGPDVTIKAIAVWDTVGTLGIPPAPIIGIRGSAAQWKFTDTIISNKVENAFQALALDEPRFAFRPALWERLKENKTNLKQVWFPGNHGGVGGGWWDQGMSDITLAWMVDQLTPLGIEFDHDELTETFCRTLAYQTVHPYPYIPRQIPLPTPHFVKQYFPLPHWLSRLLGKVHSKPWAHGDIYHAPATADPQLRDHDDCPAYKHTPHTPVKLGTPPGRPWALGQLRFPDSFFQCFVGSWVRTPGMTMRVNPENNADTTTPLERTEERIHSSVRVRLACQGLGWDDRAPWECKALTGNPTNGVRWRLVKGKSRERLVGGGKICGSDHEEGVNGETHDNGTLYPLGEGDCDWHWVWDRKGTGRGGKASLEPKVRHIPEEPLDGYWERYLLGLSAGEKGRDVWRFALENPPAVAMH
ncbi:hypothetical protein QBC47DRAFT_370881 [Echria macrotheca]|uniref:T6SS Phospholipase effector Tle1-like catalytic domain-containing protein n=1 Tax=Echria macrotheca TaxID=438768 RepID=A0AAJ0BN77_9PEZI|nr:hypothetical protein QBC47DRAFT_370881 [Echria macrotheca]